MLHRLAQDGFKPAKYFSIDRVFRNEAVDKTHLAEFHQVRGLAADFGPAPAQGCSPPAAAAAHRPASLSQS